MAERLSSALLPSLSKPMHHQNIIKSIILIDEGEIIKSLLNLYQVY